jgi:hypothetical protein
VAQELAKLEANAKALIAKGDWTGAVRALHDLLESRADPLLVVQRKGADGTVALGVLLEQRRRAERLLAALPPKARAIYESLAGAKAQGLLDRAVKEGDQKLLREVADRYAFTRAGAGALFRLGEQQFDRGDFVLAAAAYHRVLNHGSAQTLTGPQLFKMTLAARRAGDVEAEGKAWARLLRIVAQDGLALGTRNLDVAGVELQLQLEAPRPVSSRDWLMFRGDAARNRRSVAFIPDLKKKLWSRPTLLDAFEVGQERGKEAKVWLDQALEARFKDEKRGLVPGFFPLLIDDQLVYRTYEMLNALQIRPIVQEGKVEFPAGEVNWKSVTLDGGLATYLSPGLVRWEPVIALKKYTDAGATGFLFENASVGTVMSVGEHVYLVDELSILPTSRREFRKLLSRDDVGYNSVNSTRLWGFDVLSGKILSAVPKYDPESREYRPKELYKSFWLGPPVPIGGRQYALIEKGNTWGYLGLATLDSKKKALLESITPLATMREPYGEDALRRTQPVHPAYADGILVCPTNAGAVIGYDLLTQSIRWVHIYRRAKSSEENKPLDDQAPDLAIRASWYASGPIIANGEVVLTCPDDESLTVLRLDDGEVLWKQRRADDMYVASVFSDRILLVGNQHCRALSLEDGNELWKLHTGRPSGMGVAAGNTYYLPLLSAAGTKRAGISAIDVMKGTVLWHEEAQPGQIPGNLLVAPGMLIWQNATRVEAFPLRNEKRGAAK